MTRVPLVAGNWKLNVGPRAAGALASEIGHLLSDRGPIEVAVFPTAMSIWPVLEALRGTGIEVGPQEIVPQATGAFTGANSAVLAREAGCTRALVGHSERRQHYGESDEGVRAKAVAALRAGLLPIVCVGETLEQRDQGEAEAIVTHQIRAALADLHADEVASMTLAYEPVWAIGTGRTATPAQAQHMHAVIRGVLAKDWPEFVGQGMRILYGGSVGAENAVGLLSQPDIDGALVGGASLKASSFAAIVAAARVRLA